MVTSMKRLGRPLEGWWLLEGLISAAVMMVHGTVGAPYNRRFISVFFWILFRKIFSPALCYIWEISKPYALDNYNT